MKDLIKQKTEEIIKFMNVSPSIEVIEENETFVVEINGEDLNFLIGYRGESLNGLQTLLATMVFKETGEWQHVVVDINGYRDNRKEKLEEMVRNFIDRVRFHNKPVEMPSMNPYERRQVHMYVSDYPDIESESTGEGRDRRVVLKLK